MDTYRVQLPHPQPIENEEEFVTNSGRTVKRPIVGNDKEDSELKLPDPSDEDLIGSGLSVLSADYETKDDTQDGQLSDSVQAELHLSLDRLSENYDPEELKKLRQKSENSRTLSQLSEMKRHSSRTIISPAHPVTSQTPRLISKEVSGISEDSLDAEISKRTPLPTEMELETSGEFVVSAEEDDDRTIVADSLNYQTFGDGVTTASSAHSAKKSDVSKEILPNRTPKEDKYADLRYNPNFRKEAKSSKDMENTDANEYEDLPPPDDSLDDTVPAESATGGGIVIHKKGFYSPATISPTRLSADPVKLRQTNALYEKEFNKMLQAEVLGDVEPEYLDERDELRGALPQELAMPRTESYSVLIRKLEQQDKKSTSDDPVRIGGYQLLPDRHRIPSASRGAPTQETYPSKQERTPRKLISPKSYQPPEDYFYPGKKDPLVALSPREKKKVSIAPTPPKMLKPKDIDYIELNKLKVARKTNSAGYLDLHRKRSRKVEMLETRSQSEIKQSTLQVDRLRNAKHQNLNKGKVIRQRSEPFNTGSHYPRPRNDIHNGEWYSYVDQYSNGHIDPSILQQHPGNARARQPLPIPSQAAQYSPRHLNRPLPNANYVEGTPRDAHGNYFSPRVRPVQDQTSPIMNAYQSRFTTDVYQPNVLNPDNGNVLRHRFHDKNVEEASQRQFNVWRNPYHERDMLPNEYVPQSNQSSGKFNRRVTFMGDNEPVAIEGLDGDLASSISGNGYGFNRYKVPLPPTPPSKSQRHTVQRFKPHPAGKENEGGYYDVREETYAVLPPILKPTNKSPPKQSPLADRESEKSENNGSYIEEYEKEKARRKFQYKIYTLDDYKNLKKDVKLGGLGPDLLSARAKMQKVDRAKQYAELIRKEHMTSAVIKQKENVYEPSGVSAPGFDEKHHFSATMDEKQRQEMLERRMRAIEYSKSIPKPKSKPIINQPPTNSEMHSASSNYSPDIPVPNSEEGMDFNYGLLEMMKERHEKEKAQVAAFAGSG